MKPFSSIENLLNAAEQQLSSSSPGNREISIDNLLKQSVSLFENLNLLQPSEQVIEDYLTFQYGICTAADDLDNQLEVKVVRHFVKRDILDGFHYKLSVALYFSHISLLDLGLYHLDMRSFDTIQKWIREIRKSQGYKIIKPCKANKYKVELIKHTSTEQVC